MDPLAPPSLSFPVEKGADVPKPVRGLAGAAAVLAIAVMAAGPAGAQPKPNLPGTPQQMRELRAKLRASEAQVRKIASEKSLNYRALMEIAEAVGTRLPDIDVPTLVDLVRTQAQRLAVLQAQVAAHEAETAGEAGAPLLRRAKVALDAGQLDEADQALAELAELQSLRLDKALADWAATTMRRAELALVRLDFDGARSLYRQLESRAGTDAVRMKWQSAMGVAETYYQEGQINGDNNALRRAFEEYRDKALPLAPSTGRTSDLAVTHNNLGNVLTLWGARSGSAGRLRDAALAYARAMSVWTEDSAPSEWARTQNNLGNAFFELAQLSNRQADADDAIAAYRASLTRLGAQDRAGERAQVYNNLGNALTFRGEMGGGSITLLEEAVVTFKMALADQPQSKVPHLWAKTKSNLGNAYTALAIRQPPKREQLAKAAVEVLLEALTVRTENSAPYDWATTQNNLGMALQAQGRLEDAVAAYREAHRVRTRKALPFQWALTTENLGTALVAIARRDSSCETARAGERELAGAAEVFAAPQYVRNKANVALHMAKAGALRERLCR